jgi:hypothetical protein
MQIVLFFSLCFLIFATLQGIITTSRFTASHEPWNVTRVLAILLGTLCVGITLFAGKIAVGMLPTF